MKKMLKKVGLTLVVLLLAIQLYRPSRTNPPEDPQQRLQAQIAISPEAAAVIERSCSDCHSHRTDWPWYSNVAPASWIVASHVRHAKEHLNFSEWGGYDKVDAMHHLEEICEEVSEGEMPLPSYLLVHRDARLSEADVKSLCDWTAAAKRSLGGEAEDREEAEAVR